VLEVDTNHEVDPAAVADAARQALLVERAWVPPSCLIRHDARMTDSGPVLSVAQAYEAAFRFVWQYREREVRPCPETLDLMLVHMEPAPDAYRTNDPAAWSDWQQCVEATLRGDELPRFPRT
jgi:hypothetical protein